jgi:hypothetical protein
VLPRIAGALARFGLWPVSGPTKLDQHVDLDVAAVCPTELYSPRATPPRLVLGIIGAVVTKSFPIDYR